MNKLFVPALALLAACGGVSRNTPLNELEGKDAEELCDMLGPEETFTCDMGGGVTFDITTGCDPDNVDTNSSNEFPDSCDATVGDWLDCNDAMHDMLSDDACGMMSMPPECAAIMSCIDTGG